MYVYAEVRPQLFTEEGQRAFIQIRDWVKHALKETGAFQMGKAMGAAGCGDTWVRMACVDRLVELGEIAELPRPCWGQFRVFASPKAHDR